MKLPQVTDSSIEKMVSTLLRVGVLVAAIVVLSGGLFLLARHGAETVSYRAFRGEAAIDRLIPDIARGAIAMRARSVIQFGILLLIATPIARVALSLVAFGLERDHKYMAITAVVLCILLYSLISGAVTG